jgi:hypothetical protein
MRRLAISVTLVTACLVPAATAAAVDIDPASKDFGTVTVGTSSATASFTLTPAATVNTSPLQGDPGTTFVADDFAIHNVDCPHPLFTTGAQSSCQFTVTLMPTGIGPRSFQMTFGDTAPPMSATVDLIGSGLAPPPSATGGSPAKRKKCKKKHHRAAVAKKKCKKKKR